MKRSLMIASVLIWALMLALGAGSASAQTIPPGGSIYNPPMPPPPPSPKIYIPAIPKMDEVTQPSLRSPVRPSFGDRVSRCLDDAAAAGYNQAGRATYSRSCANQN
jgi:hypothetical protein